MSKVEEKLYSFEKSKALFEEAAAIIPGGIYGHFSPTLTVPGFFPFYAAKAEGCRYTDVDGNEFIDYMCGYGPNVLGYLDPDEVDLTALDADPDTFVQPNAGEVLYRIAGGRPATPAGLALAAGVDGPSDPRTEDEVRS